MDGQKNAEDREEETRWIANFLMPIIRPIQLLKSIRLEGSVESYTSEILELISERMTFARAIHFDRCTFDDFSQFSSLLSRTPKLTTLDLAHLKFNNHPESPRSEDFPIPPLTELNLMVEFDAEAGTPYAAEWLTLNKFDTKLQKLILVQYSCLQPLAPLLLPTAGPSLQSLSLSYLHIPQRRLISSCPDDRTFLNFRHNYVSLTFSP